MNKNQNKSYEDDDINDYYGHENADEVYIFLKYFKKLKNYLIFYHNLNLLERKRNRKKRQNYSRKTYR